MVCIMTALLLLTFIPAQSKAAEKNPSSTNVVESAEVKALIARVNEINAMDKSALSSSEKKELRKELRAIKRDVNNDGHGGVVYVSGGLILLIVLLIILL